MQRYPPNHPGLIGSQPPGPNPYASQPAYTQQYATQPSPFQTQPNPYGQPPNPYQSQPPRPGPPIPGNPYQSQTPQAPMIRQSQNWYSFYTANIQPQELLPLQQWFMTVDKDRSGTIDANELQMITFDGQPIGLTVATKLVQVFDEDRNGSLDFSEYVALHKFVGHMRQAFFAADSDRSGRIEAREIFQALTNAGFNYLTMPSVMELLAKFDKTRRGLDWLEFLLMSAHIAHVRSVFLWNDKNKSGIIHLNLDQLTQVAAFLQT